MASTPDLRQRGAWTLREYTVQTHDEGPVAQHGLVWGPFGFRGDKSDAGGLLYTVTHLPTGYRINGVLFSDASQAREFCARIYPLTDWERVRCGDRELGDKVQKIEDDILSKGK